MSKKKKKNYSSKTREAATAYVMLLGSLAKCVPRLWLHLRRVNNGHSRKNKKGEKNGKL